MKKIKEKKYNSIRKSIDKINEEFSNEVGISELEQVHSLFKNKKNYHMRFNEKNKKI